MGGLPDSTVDNSNGYPQWVTWLWRLLRGAVATGLMTALALQVDWSKPDQAIKVFILSFLSGAFQALALALRDQLSQGDKSSVWQKLPI